MTPEKVLEVVERYRREFERMGIKKKDYPHDEMLLFQPSIIRDQQMLEHCHGMLDKMVEFVRKGRIEKTFRWLGFVQGCLWATRIHTIGQMANHNRPDS